MEFTLCFLVAITILSIGGAHIVWFRPEIVTDPVKDIKGPLSKYYRSSAYLSNARLASTMFVMFTILMWFVAIKNFFFR